MRSFDIPVKPIEGSLEHRVSKKPEAEKETAKIIIELDMNAGLSAGKIFGLLSTTGIEDDVTVRGLVSICERTAAIVTLVPKAGLRAHGNNGVHTNLLCVTAYPEMEPYLLHALPTVPGVKSVSTKEALKPQPA